MQTSQNSQNPNNGRIRRLAARVIGGVIAVSVMLALTVSPAFARSGPPDRIGSDQVLNAGEIPDECRGEAVDEVVLPNETWYGTAENDVVIVIGPYAEAWPGLGDDLVCVYLADSEYAHGGSKIQLADGTNTVITYSGDNDIYGVDGTDRVYLNGDVETAELGGGDDTVYANGAEAVYVDAGDGKNYVVGSPGGDHLIGGADTDVLRGNGGADTIAGGDSTDFLYGGADFDDIDGEDGFDHCYDSTGGADFTSCEDTVVTPAGPASLKTS